LAALADDQGVTAGNAAFQLVLLDLQDRHKAAKGIEPRDLEVALRGEFQLAVGTVPGQFHCAVVDAHQAPVRFPGQCKRIDNSLPLGRGGGKLQQRGHRFARIVAAWLEPGGQQLAHRQGRARFGVDGQAHRGPILLTDAEFAEKFPFQLDRPGGAGQPVGDETERVKLKYLEAALPVQKPESLSQGPSRFGGGTGRQRPDQAPEVGYGAPAGESVLADDQAAGVGVQLEPPGSPVQAAVEGQLQRRVSRLDQPVRPADLGGIYVEQTGRAENRSLSAGRHFEGDGTFRLKRAGHLRTPDKKRRQNVGANTPLGLEVVYRLPPTGEDVRGHGRTPGNVQPGQSDVGGLDLHQTRLQVAGYRVESRRDAKTGLGDNGQFGTVGRLHHQLGDRNVESELIHYAVAIELQVQRSAAPAAEFRQGQAEKLCQRQLRKVQVRKIEKGRCRNALSDAGGHAHAQRGNDALLVERRRDGDPAQLLEASGGVLGAVNTQVQQSLVVRQLDRGVGLANADAIGSDVEAQVLENGEIDPPRLIDLREDSRPINLHPADLVLEKVSERREFSPDGLDLDHRCRRLPRGRDRQTVQFHPFGPTEGHLPDGHVHAHLPGHLVGQTLFYGFSRQPVRQRHVRPRRGQRQHGRQPHQPLPPPSFWLVAL